MSERPTFMDRLREAPTWVKIALPVAAVIFVLSALTGDSSDNGGGGSAEDGSEAVETASEKPPAVTEAVAAQIVEDNFDEADPNPDVACAQPGVCHITYFAGDILGIDTDLELVEKQRHIWKALFENPTFKDGTLTLRSHVTTVGGKEQVADVLTVSCDRAAANKIDWDNVDAEGLKVLCDWNELVEF